MYDELVSSLRICAEGVHCDKCAKWEIKQNGGRNACEFAICTEAADAIEELVRKEKFHEFLWNTIQPNEMEQYLAMYRAQDVPSEPPKEE